jgi:branched-subunit amino acid ABC-type transport system permease component
MILQIVLDGLINAALIAPPAVAFTVMVGVLRFTNFAVGSYITFGAFAAYVANVPLGFPILAASIVAMAATAMLVWLSDVVVFRPIRQYDPVSLLVVSVALAFIIEQTLRLFFGGNVRAFDLPLERPLVFYGLRITPDQILLLVLSATASLGVQAILSFTRLGRAMRATADNAGLAEIRGIRHARIVNATLLICGAMLGLAGVLGGLEIVIEPLIGWNFTIPVIAAAILGGIGSAGGALIGAIVVGLTEQLAAIALAPAYKSGVGFVIIAVLLLFRPHGLLGQPEIRK